MADAVASRIGQINAAGDVKAIFLKKFAGEVLTTFEQTNVMKPLHTIRTINNGKSAQFPVTGTASAAYHVVGEDLVDSGNTGGIQVINHAEKIINIDELLVATTFVANLDELRNHYDVRSIYSGELGRALANKFDRQVIQTALINTATFDGSGIALLLSLPLQVITQAVLSIVPLAQTLLTCDSSVHRALEPWTLTVCI